MLSVQGCTSGFQTVRSCSPPTEQSQPDPTPLSSDLIVAAVVVITITITKIAEGCLELVPTVEYTRRHRNVVEQIH